MHVIIDNNFCVVKRRYTKKLTNYFFVHTCLHNALSMQSKDEEIKEDLPKLDLSSDVEFSRSNNGADRLHSERREKSPTKSVTSTNSYFHIPSFLGMVILF